MDPVLRRQQQLADKVDGAPAPYPGQYRPDSVRPARDGARTATGESAANRPGPAPPQYCGTPPLAAAPRDRVAAPPLRLGRPPAPRAAAPRSDSSCRTTACAYRSPRPARPAAPGPPALGPRPRLGRRLRPAAPPPRYGKSAGPRPRFEPCGWPRQWSPGPRPPDCAYGWRTSPRTRPPRRTTRRSPPRSRPAPARIPDPWKSQRRPPLGSPAAAFSCASTHPVWKAGPPDRPRRGAADRWAPGSVR